jgi:Rha family phage regulatory protein
MKLVEIKSNQLVTTSKIVAEAFKKPHKTVLRNIENLECSEEFRRHNFVLSYYLSPQNKKITCYTITRDGVSFLCMGFTGKRAAQWKEKYINAFNQMEKGMLSIDSRMQKLSIEQSELKQLGSEWAKFGHDINRKKKAVTRRAIELMNDVQMKLEF